MGERPPPPLQTLREHAHNKQRIIAQVFLGVSRVRLITALAFELEVHQILQTSPFGIAHTVQVIYVRKVHEQPSHVDRELWISVASLLETRFCQVAEEVAEWMIFRYGLWSCRLRQHSVCTLHGKAPTNRLMTL